MKVKTLIIIPLIMMTLSCRFNFSKEVKKKRQLPAYEQDKVWTLHTTAYSCSDRGQQYGRYYYILEYKRSGKNKEIFYSKIDLKYGERLWSTPTYSTFRCYPLLITRNGKNYILIKNRGFIDCYDDATGLKTTTITYFENDIEKNRTYMRASNWILVDDSIYWPNSPDYNPHNTEKPGIIKLDLSSVDFSEGAPETQYVKPALVWQNRYDDQSVMMTPVAKDGVIYFITFNQFEKYDASIMGAYDTRADTLRWEKKTYKLFGYGFVNMYIVDDRLYILEDPSQGCYDISTGKTLWEQTFSLEEMKKQMSVGASIYSVGITWWNKKFYFTNTAGYLSSEMSGIPEEFITNIQCIDENGKFIWGDLPEGSGSLWTKPEVVNGKCLVVVWDSLRVYDAETGEILGVDYSVKSLGMDKNAVYDDMFIYFNLDQETLTSELVAIRP